MAGSLIAIIGIAVLVVAVLALRHPNHGGTSAGSSVPHPTNSATVSSAASTSASKSAPKTSASHPSTTKKLALIVLNNSTISKLADTATAQFRAGGWTVTRFGNYTVKTLSTAAYYDPKVSGAKASALALRSQFPKIRRVLARYSELPSGPIVVVLTSDYSGG